MARKPNLARIALPLALALSLATSAPALGASLATEQHQGAQLLSRVEHGTLNPKALSSNQYENLGEYLMGRALGSMRRHQQMNSLMDAMMGPNASDVMHIYLGKRYLGVTAKSTARYGQLWGLMGVMMSGYRGSALAGMMGAYLHGQGTTGYIQGTGMMSGYGFTSPVGTSTGTSWPTSAIVAVCIIGLLLIGGGIAFVVTRTSTGARRSQQPRT